jgi:hypothetical protein
MPPVNAAFTAIAQSGACARGGVAAFSIAARAAHDRQGISGLIVA